MTNTWNERINKIMEASDFLSPSLLNLPGFCIGIGTKDGMLFEKSYGDANFQTKKEMTTDTVFHMASVSKLFTGTAIMQLYEQGLLDIDVPATEALPYFQLADSRYKSITIKHLLTHTSGMPDCEDYEWDNPQFDEGALERYVKSQTHLKLMCRPGEKFSYCNISYEILGDIISKISGIPYEDYIKKELFEPLQMKNSTMLTFERNMDEIAAPHIKDEHKNIRVSEVFPYNRSHSPSSTLTTNIGDLHKWAMAHLNKGQGPTGKILKEASYDKIWRPYVAVPNNGEQMGLSWFMRQQEGFTLYGHEGTDLGFRASFWILPQKGLFIGVAANLENAPVKKINKKILELILPAIG